MLQAKTFTGLAARIMAGEEVMSAKAHGSCPAPVQATLRWNSDRETADRICCFNRHYAEHSGYFTGTSFVSDEADTALPNHFGF